MYDLWPGGTAAVQVFWGAALVWANARLSLLPTKVSHGEEILEAPGRIRWGTLAVHLLFLGLFSLLWISFSESSVSKFRYSVQPQSVLNLTLGNDWPVAVFAALGSEVPGSPPATRRSQGRTVAVFAALGSEVPAELALVVRGTKALFSTLFLAADSRPQISRVVPAPTREIF